MPALRSQLRTHLRGMTLIELMVGLGIGLITTVAVMNVMASAESQRRAATTGADALSNGAVALDAVRRDLLQAGYGLAAFPAALGCPVRAQFAGGTAWWLTLAPVVIVNGANGAPDSLQILSSGKTAASVPLATTAAHAQAATSFTVRASYPTVAGDLLVAAPATWDSAANWCTLVAATATTTTTITHDSSNSWNSGQASRMPAAGYAAGSVLLNLGSPVYRIYAVASSNTLQLASLAAATGTTTTQDAFPEIVDLQALYAKDTNGDGAIDSYDTATPTTAAAWRQVLGIRVALVARATQASKDDVTSALPQWNLGTAVTAPGTSACTDGSGGQCIGLKIDRLTDWKKYRYKVFDTLVPLRNVLWNS